MRFIAKNYGPQAHVDIELGSLVTLFVGPNNTGKSFVSRAIYSILRSCRGDTCDVNKLVALLMNNSIASERDLWTVSRDFSGKFSLILDAEDLGFKAEIRYDKSKPNPLEIKMSGKAGLLSSLYVPAYRVISLGFPYILAGHAVEFKDIILKLIPQITAAFVGVEKTESTAPKIPSAEFDSDVLYIFLRPLLLMLKPVLEPNKDMLEATGIAFPPTLLDLSIAAYYATKKVGIDERLRVMFKKLFPEFQHKALGFQRGERYDVPEIPPYLLSSGMLQALPILCLLNLALIHVNQGYEHIYIFIDEPELNLELLRQTRFAEMLMDLTYSIYNKERRISIIIATHSDFIAYAITRWLARRNLRDLAKVYEFMPGGVKEREIDEFGEVKFNTFSEAIKKVFFEEELTEKAEESNDLNID